MPRLQIKNYRTGETIFAGRFASAKECVEQACRDHVNLDYADLRHTNLGNAMLDDITMRHARLDYANLTGANLSEAQLSNTSFAYATLHAVCFCYSSLENCNFDNALFGATDITGCALQKSRFSALSAFSLNFRDSARMDNCVYRAAAGTMCPVSRPPLVLKGLSVPVILMDLHLKIGHTVKTCREWRQQTNDNLPAGAGDLASLYSSVQRHLNGLIELYESGALQTGNYAALHESA